MIAFILPITAKNFTDNTLQNFFFIICVSLISACTSILYIGCNNNERKFIFSNILNLKNKIFKQKNDSNN